MKCNRVISVLGVFLLGLVACTTPSQDKSKISKTPIPSDAATALFAGGCFWCVEAYLQKHPGVYEVVSGFSGGDSPNPTYQQVSSGQGGRHRESVKVFYDAKTISYEKLLDAFWATIDPTDGGGQFADRGHHYSPAIYYANDEEKSIAEKSKQDLDQSKRFSQPIAVVIEAAKPFYAAEEYHQDYFLKNPEHYNSYKEGSGRGPFIRKYWKK